MIPNDEPPGLVAAVEPERVGPNERTGAKASRFSRRHTMTEEKKTHHEAQIGPRTTISMGTTYSIGAMLVALTWFLSSIVSDLRHEEPRSRKAEIADMRKQFNERLELIRKELQSARLELRDLRQSTADRWPATFMRIWQLQAQRDNPNFNFPDLEKIIQNQHPWR